MCQLQGPAKCVFFGMEGVKMLFGAYINCPDQNFSDPTIWGLVRQKQIRVNLCWGLGRCVFFKRATDKISFYKLDETGNFRFQERPFFFGYIPTQTCQGRFGTQLSTPTSVGWRRTRKKRTYLKTKNARLIKFMKWNFVRPLKKPVRWKVHGHAGNARRKVIKN